MSRRKQWKLGLVRATAKSAVPEDDAADVTISTRNVVGGSFSVRVGHCGHVHRIVQALESAFNVRAVRCVNRWGEPEVQTYHEGGTFGLYDRVLFYFEEVADNG